MKLATALALLASAPAIVMGVAIPNDLGDGVFLVGASDSGEYNITKVGDFAPDPRRWQSSDTTHLEARGNPIPGNSEVGCKGRTIEDHQGFASCQQAFIDYLHGGRVTYIPPRHLYMTRVGKSVFAICNYSKTGSQLWTEDEIHHFARIMDSEGLPSNNNHACGRWKAGYVWVQDWAKLFARDYIDEKGFKTEVCGNL